METIEFDALSGVIGGTLQARPSPSVAVGGTRPVRTRPSVFTGPTVVNGPVLLDTSFQQLIQRQGGNSVHELRISR